MNGTSNLASGIFLLSSWFMKLTVSNLLWLICQLPLIWIIVQMFYAESQTTVLGYVLLTFLFFPFLFFPATTALFSLVREWLIGEEENSIIKAYFSYYKESYKRSVKAGGVLSVLWGICLADIYYFYQSNVIFFLFFIGLGIVLFIYTINFFSAFSHYEIPLKDVYKKAFYITFGSPILSVVIFMSSLALMYLSLKGYIVLIIFFNASILALLSFSSFYRIYRKATFMAE
ncbi:YesL family protein [Alkalihalobacillus sp. 1P02AB]|uniref:YesL family protein n=1 Tax=Alkalihalobacillus sp. 1P02AB TaxID=3132260 RepID=UPI0039A70C8D